LRLSDALPRLTQSDAPTARLNQVLRELLDATASSASSQ